jgi:hypothetical protein
MNEIKDLFLIAIMVGIREFAFQKNIKNAKEENALIIIVYIFPDNNKFK